VSSPFNIWAILPAAGIGRRMQSAIPKQYLKLLGRPVIEHSINRLLAVEEVSGLIVALQPDDPYWPEVVIDSEKPVLLAQGGKERCHSVINALDVLTRTSGYDPATTWALVHDAVRPCVSIDDIRYLIAQAAGTESGGLLAMPVRDTLKRQDDAKCVQSTVDRTGLWHALTPQLFSSDRLYRALSSALAEDFLVTDEASAMEHAGYHPLLVQGGEENIKITRPADLRLSALYLQSLTQTAEIGDLT
jgi:2-C-methyl-D-erythritol 4-phosphate cytidylyltransferase